MYPILNVRNNFTTLPGSHIKLKGRVNAGMKAIERKLSRSDTGTMSTYSWARPKFLVWVDDNQPEIRNKPSLE